MLLRSGLMSIERLLHWSLCIWIILNKIRFIALIKIGLILRWNLIVHDRWVWWLVWWRSLWSWIGHCRLKWWISLRFHVGSRGRSIKTRVRIMYRHRWLRIHWLVDNRCISVGINLRIIHGIPLRIQGSRNRWDSSSVKRSGWSRYWRPFLHR